MPGSVITFVMIRASTSMRSSSMRVREPADDRLLVLERTVETLSARVAALEAGRGPRDDEDYALVLVVAASTQGLTFTAAELWRHRDVDETLAEALESADIDNPRQAGKWLSRLEGCDVSGWRIERVGVDREGVRWRLGVSRV